MCLYSKILVNNKQIYMRVMVNVYFRMLRKIKAIFNCCCCFKKKKKTSIILGNKDCFYLSGIFILRG